MLEIFEKLLEKSLKLIQFVCNVFSSTMSFTLSISSLTSTSTINYSPALQLDGEYECGLLYFSTFNSIPNIDRTNNKLHYGDSEIIEIPEGSYELQDISDYLRENVKNCSFELTCNNNTLKTAIKCSKDIHFEKNPLLGKVLGFGIETLKANILNVSRFPVSILSTTVLRIECDIVSGSYINGKPSHTIHEFAPNVPPGYRIIEIPRNVIYFPVNQNSICSITIRIVDANNNLINLRGEDIQLYLHLKKKNDRLQ